jgi:chromosome segregation ATPase
MSWRDNPNHWRQYKEFGEKKSIAEAITRNAGIQEYLMSEMEKGGDEKALLEKIEHAEKEIAELKEVLKSYDHSHNNEDQSLRALEAKRRSLEKDITALERKLHREEGSDKDFELLNRLYEAITAVEDAIVGIAVSKSTRSDGTRKRRGKRKQKTRTRS